MDIREEKMRYQILTEVFEPLLGHPFPKLWGKKKWIQLDLSRDNTELPRNKAMDLPALQSYIDGCLEEQTAFGAWGGYAERRDIYRRSEVFATDAKKESDDYRNVHLGIDFWLPAGTAVHAPLPGVVHSFRDNAESGNYGPTIILLHEIGNIRIHSLYGHLSRRSLEGLHKGKLIRRGEAFAELGEVHENKDWPPHLHFQLIYKMQGHKGDYPGVCTEREAEAYLKNCPDPMRFFSW